MKAFVKVVYKTRTNSWYKLIEWASGAQRLSSLAAWLVECIALSLLRFY